MNNTATRVKENIAHIPREVEKFHLTHPEIMPVESAVLVYQYVDSILDGLETADNVESKVLGNLTAGIRQLIASKPKWEAIFLMIAITHNVLEYGLEWNPSEADLFVDQSLESLRKNLQKNFNAK